MKISIILPTYEESGHIADLVMAICQALTDIKDSYEILVIDDSPTLDTQQAVEKFCQAHPHYPVKCIHRQASRGLADAIYFGVQQAKYDGLVFMDSDFNHHPRYLPIMAMLLDHYDLIIGSRYVTGGWMRSSLFRYIGSFCFNSMVRTFLRTRVHDNLSGFIAIRRSLLNKLNLAAVFHGYGDYCIRLIFNARFFKPQIIEIPVVYENRASGESKTNLPKVLLGYTKSVLHTLCFFPRPTKIK